MGRGAFRTCRIKSYLQVSNGGRRPPQPGPRLAPCPPPAPYHLLRVLTAPGRRMPSSVYLGNCPSPHLPSLGHVLVVSPQPHLVAAGRCILLPASSAHQLSPRPSTTSQRAPTTTASRHSHHCRAYCLVRVSILQPPPPPRPPISSSSH